MKNVNGRNLTKIPNLMYRILVPDAETRKAFDIISILKNAFPKIPLICGNTDGSISQKRYLKNIFQTSSETLQTDNNKLFVEDLLSISEKYNDDVIIFVPTEEKTIAHFYRFLRKYGRKNLVYILPAENVYNVLRDKRRLNEFCAKNNLNAPLYYSVKRIDELLPEQYPILLKPCIGSGSEGQYRLYEPGDFTNEIRIVVSKEPYLVQELIPNGHEVHGVFYLYYDGEIVDAYTHERIRTSPPKGGVTVLSKFTDNTELIKEGKAILDKIGWNGLIMLEYLYDVKSGKYKVIEANPRIWGSIMLSEFSGKNFLTNYVRLCMGKKPVSNYRQGNIYIRWFFPVDFLNYIKSFGRIQNFWNFKNTCFINWSYANRMSAIKFNLFHLFSIKNVKRYFRR